MTDTEVLHKPAVGGRPGPKWALMEKASIRYTFYGERGRPALLLHEMGGSLESWDPVIERFPAGQRIVRCDMRGAGGSEKIRAATTCDAFADDIVALLDHLDITTPVDVAGVAIGGCIGLSLAARHPSRVRKLAAINPPTDAIGASGDVLRERAQVADTVGMRGLVEKALGRSYPEHLRTGRAYDDYVARFLTNDPTSYAFILRALADIDFAGVLEKISCPTLFVSGRDDLVRRTADIAEVSKRVPGARFIQVEGGHIPSVQAPAPLASVLTDFFGW